MARQGKRRRNSGDEDDVSRDNPEFFKIFLPQLCSHRLRIPPAFLVKFGENIPKNVTLRTPSGRPWQVHMHQISEHWFFQKGWPEFALENSLEEGDFLIFSYDDDAVFLVKVFATHCCRKEIGSCSMLDKEPDENTLGAEASEPENDGDDDGTTGRKTGARNPSFSVKMEQYSIDKSCTYIPAAFWKAHMKNSKMATLWIKGKSWVVKLDFNNGRRRFAEGWTKFAHDNSMKQGNICTFQLMDSDNLSLSVTICR